MEKLLFRSAAAWAIFGLLSGLYYREFTRLNAWDHPTFTQLSTVHTHALALGCLFFLVMLALERTFAVSRHSAHARRAYLAWNVGLALTAGMQLLKGSLQVAGVPAYSHPALAGLSGLGHIVMTVAFALYFHSLAKALQTTEK
ncbi:DUF2871 domain-containing protein [Buchananella hordeovulneris]|uniref:DUF2871 domain-containing protein n=1 Tax=Buchananella hordeovulneris TaxID=52770 RepID=A0A1Q5PUA3_9ACTO|nr:DUF2871 domain-containing protein [Buchananella hordeovulneris]OKL51168.1 hypothetical protein BSZ40_08775 [Buchananella hordeovulneris]